MSWAFGQVALLVPIQSTQRKKKKVIWKKKLRLVGSIRIVQRRNIGQDFKTIVTWASQFWVANWGAICGGGWGHTDSIGWAWGCPLAFTFNWRSNDLIGLSSCGGWGTGIWGVRLVCGGVGRFCMPPICWISCWIGSTGSPEWTGAAAWRLGGWWLSAWDFAFKDKNN